jgi:hypothetical protein
MFERRLNSVLLLAVAFLWALSGAAFADTTLNLTFDSTTGHSLSHTAGNSGVQSYVQSFLSSGQHVTVTGAKSGYGYTGDGHVVGPCKSGTCKSVTLGTDSSGNNTDNFIINNGPTSSGITMTFTGVAFTQVSFDLEIFPDGTCPDGTKGCGSNWPDFKFYVNGNKVDTWLAQLPGSGNCDTLNPTACASTYSHSPASGSSSKELAPQLITFNYVYSGAAITSLSFQDWPAEVGIDNLKLTIPEPSSLALLGGVFGMLGIIRRKFVA